ncbi:MAG TPA: hypothetical protein VF432_32060 [Thermoanaerobaculia bacterium]
MKKTKKAKKTRTTKKRPSRRTTTPVPPEGNRAPSQPVSPDAGKDAPGTDATAAFKAGKDL